jgi:hypothetical protein
VIARQQPLDPWLAQHGGQEFGGDLALQQPVAVLCEARMVTHRIVDPDADEPAEQQIEFDPLHQLALRTHRIERQQQHRPQQLLRWNRRPPQAGIERRELARQCRQGGVRDLANRPQRMIRPNSVLQVYIAEKTAANFVVAAHRHPVPWPRGPHRDKSATTFSTAC